MGQHQVGTAWTRHTSCSRVCLDPNCGFLAQGYCRLCWPASRSGGRPSSVHRSAGGWYGLHLRLTLDVWLLTRRPLITSPGQAATLLIALSPSITSHRDQKITAGSQRPGLFAWIPDISAGLLAIWVDLGVNRAIARQRHSTRARFSLRRISTGAELLSGSPRKYESLCFWPETRNETRQVRSRLALLALSRFSRGGLISRCPLPVYLSS